ITGPPAGTRIGRRDQLKARGIGDGAAAADDHHRPLLQGLAQRLERRRLELRELVQEEHASMGPGHLARSRDAAATTYQAGHRDRVVRGAERAPPLQRTPLPELT